jgi:hypothetical protein
LGKHRVRLRATRGFPTETLHTMADVARLAIENNMSARARLVEAVYRDQDKAYDIFVGTTVPDDRRCAAQLEVAMATVLGLLPEQITMTVNTVEQSETTTTAWKRGGWNGVCIGGVVSRSCEPATLIHQGVHL